MFKNGKIIMKINIYLQILVYQKIYRIKDDLKQILEFNKLLQEKFKQKKKEKNN